MAKGKTTVYFCQNCGFESTKWLGQCPGCREWNSFVEETMIKTSKAAQHSGKNPELTGIEEISLEKNKIFKNSLDNLLPQKMISTVIELSGIDQNKKVNEITREERVRLVQLLKNFEITLHDFRPIEEAIITAGGISIKEINPKTMESKLIKGLYFAGEIIDVDAYTGGFNLQIAYSTGYTAGGATNV